MDTSPIDVGNFNFDGGRLTEVLLSRIHFTPTEVKILRMLADGLRHTKDELMECMWDDMGATVNMQMHIAKIRKKLNLTGHYIVCETSGNRTYYRHVLLITSVCESNKPLRESPRLLAKSGKSKVSSDQQS